MEDFIGVNSLISGWMNVWDLLKYVCTISLDEYYWLHNRSDLFVSLRREGIAANHRERHD